MSKKALVISTSLRKVSNFEALAKEFEKEEIEYETNIITYLKLYIVFSARCL
ncbi:hypothetical protein [Sedimentibacter hydroxybenzoicus]|uniref:hypothetical protein n=1 Tax=Sedimentibacter hydroxybenzoicus TaxID=29345 RepID=UPI001FED031A|nr:hypothetical protein [Sedimentibacter hydroxybenzoicus]